MGPKGSLKKVFKHIKLNKNEISIFLFYLVYFKKVFKHIKLNKNEISIFLFYLVYQRAKAVLREKFIALNAYISKD